MLNSFITGIAKCISTIPLHRSLALGRGLGWIYGSVVRYHREDALEALTRVYPEKSPAEINTIIRKMYANLGMNIIELARLITLHPDEIVGNYVRLTGEEHLKEALARNKGALILTGHIGSWDLLCTITPIIGYPLTVITKDLKQKSLNRLWLDIREKFGVKFLPAHNSYRQCLKVLRNKEIIGFILDQNMIDKEGVFVDFFGKPACTSPGLAYMSAQAKAPVVPAFIKRQPDGSHIVHIQPMIEPPENREPETIREATQTYTKIIEDHVKKNPADWIWIHRRWRTKMPETAT